MNALLFEHTSFSYGNSGFHLQDVTCAVEEGTFVSLLGPNGSGKSTLLKLACGLLSPLSGAVMISGENIASLDRRTLAKRIAYVTQHSIPPFRMTALEFVLLGRIPYARGFGFTNNSDLHAAEESMAQLDCLQFAGARLSGLSGGELQRVLVARALAQQPAILLLDEPNSHLDVSHQLSLYRALREWQHAKGTTIVASTHDLNLASMHSNTCLVLSHGALVSSGTPREVFSPALLHDVFAIHAAILDGFYGASPAVQLQSQ
ncbi:MAG TPA: ABC transporter ATP-binding protein [Candidatus Kapabacteria bacterium]|nr:ABC transporter ATP-binding protein [Candidatus Kapabacteria bacterium]